MNEMKKITSFTVDHTRLREGMYISRIDGDVTTFDLRTRVPNAGEYMDHSTMHTLEHLFATYIRNGEIGASVLYFGPMGCQTGFYLLTRGLPAEDVRRAVIAALQQVVAHDGEVFGNSAVECGNYQTLDLQAGRREAKRYLDILLARGECGFSYEGDAV